MFRRLRNYTDGDNPIIDTMRGGKYPRKLGRFVIDHVRDLTTGFDSRQKDGTAVIKYFHLHWEICTRIADILYGPCLIF